uniref:FIP-RBD domain-containing protein n=1 Tax=Parascaris univalens TaxID=6257 RepID=A0A914ZVW4_PARUN
MEPNNLVVTVLSARGLTLKGHNKLDAYVSLSLSGEGSWKSKVQTDIRKTTGDCSWDQRCEFVVYGLDSVMAITVYHKTMLGNSEAIGALEFPLKAQYGKRAPVWLRLHKKGKIVDGSSQQKYRGELQLKFEFSNKLSTSMTSLNTVHGSTAFDALRRKMHLGKKRDRNAEAASIAAFPQHTGRRSPITEGINFSSSRRSLQMNDLNREGLITPPVNAKQPDAALTDRSSPALTSVEPLVEESVHGLCSNAGSSVSMRQSRTPSPVSLWDVDDFSSTVPRPQSTTSSGFGSAKSGLGVNETFNKLRQSPLIERPYSCVTSLMARTKLPKDSKKPSYEDLEKQIIELRIELTHREAKEKDLNEYIELLLTRIMEQNPELLESVTTEPRHH